MILADKIMNLRKKNGWSQEELAENIYLKILKSIEKSVLRTLSQPSIGSVQPLYISDGAVS